MSNPNTRTFTLQGEGMNVEVITESDDIEFLNVLLPILNQNYMQTNQIKLVKRDDGIIEIHGLDQGPGPGGNLEQLENGLMQDDFGDDSSSAIENQEHVYLEIEATPEPLDRDDLMTSKRDSRLERDIHRKRLARARETEEQKVQRLEKDRKRKQEARKHESEEQRALRLAKDRQRVHQRRLMETDIQRIYRLQRNRDVKRRSRSNQKERDQTRGRSVQQRFGNGHMTNMSNGHIVSMNNSLNNMNNNGHNDVMTTGHAPPASMGPTHQSQPQHHLQPFSAMNIKQEVVPSMVQLFGQSSHNQSMMSNKPIATDILTIVSLQ